jgi:hypothetical protein
MRLLVPLLEFNLLSNATTKSRFSFRRDATLQRVVKYALLGSTEQIHLAAAAKKRPIESEINAIYWYLYSLIHNEQKQHNSSDSAVSR